MEKTVYNKIIFVKLCEAGLIACFFVPQKTKCGNFMNNIVLKSNYGGDTNLTDPNLIFVEFVQ
jgi:hypothetical protein